MFSYRHGFHAGNHADVLKHICQMLIIDKLKRKDKGFTYIDTHSGAGMYDLASEQARKTNEFKQGITRLADYAGAEPTLLAYQELTASYIKHQQYPGSPEIARVLMREQDQLHLMEWNNQEVMKPQMTTNKSSTALAKPTNAGLRAFLLFGIPCYRNGTMSKAMGLNAPPLNIKKVSRCLTLSVTWVLKTYCKWN